MTEEAWLRVLREHLRLGKGRKFTSSTRSDTFLGYRHRKKGGKGNPHEKRGKPFGIRMLGRGHREKGLRENPNVHFETKQRRDMCWEGE